MPPGHAKPSALPFICAPAQVTTNVSVNLPGTSWCVAVSANVCLCVSVFYVHMCTYVFGKVHTCPCVYVC